MARRPPEHGLFAVVAEFDRPEALLAATRAARAEGFRRLEAFSPFPVEGLAKALDFHERRIAPLFLAGGIVGALTGFGLLHALLMGRGIRPIILVVVYALSAVFLLPLALLAIAGIADTLFQFRARRASAATGSS